MGVGVGTGKRTGKSMRKLCRNYPLAIYPLVSPQQNPLEFSLLIAASAGSRKVSIVRDKFLHRGFCTSETRIWARILENEFWGPEFWTRIPGSNFLSLFFPANEAPRKIHPQDPKFNPEIGPKNLHCTSAGPFD